jgi:hypothetical protein
VKRVERPHELAWRKNKVSKLNCNITEISFPMPTKTELIWDGKYDAQGKRVAPLRVALPFQTIETINESVKDAKKCGQLWKARPNPGGIA